MKHFRSLSPLLLLARAASLRFARAIADYFVFEHPPERVGRG